MSERPYKIVERIGRQRSIDPAVSFGKLRIVVPRAQHDLERAGAAHETRQVLDAARAGGHTRRRLWLAENRRLSRGKAHVARQHELAASGAHAALDLRDGDGSR